MVNEQDSRMFADVFSDGITHFEHLAQQIETFMRLIMTSGPHGQYKQTPLLLKIHFEYGLTK